MSHPKINGYRAYIFDPARWPDTKGFSKRMDAKEVLPELELLLEHFDITRIKINLSNGSLINVTRKE